MLISYVFAFYCANIKVYHQFVLDILDGQIKFDYNKIVSWKKKKKKAPNQVKCDLYNIFVSAMWLPHRQLWATVEDHFHLLFDFQSEGHQELRNEVGPLSPTKHPVSFLLENFWF